MDQGILFDLTEFLRQPLRSGIQRVVFEIIRHWPPFCPLLPARIGPGKQLLLLPEETLDRLKEFFTAPPNLSQESSTWLTRAGQESGQAVPLEELSRYRGLLNTEVFSDINQVGFYEDLLQAGQADRIFLLVYDMLPWLQPQWFAQAIVTFPLAYLRLLRSVKHLGFISEQTRRDFFTRVCRVDRLVGPVLPLGSDGLGIAPPRFNCASRQFAMIGTLEPRKNIRNVLDAFTNLWANGIDASLVCAGRMGWLADGDRERISHLTKQPARFRWVADPTDQQVRDTIRTSRATLYPSWAEGFGLPPLESLSLGVPVIVSDSLPSVVDRDVLGQVRLKVPEVNSIQQAILSFLDDDFARQRTLEIQGLHLPHWADFSRELVAWVLRASQVSAPLSAA